MSERNPLTIPKRPYMTPESWSLERCWIDSEGSHWHSNATEHSLGSAEEHWLHRDTERSRKGPIQALKPIE